MSSLLQFGGETGRRGVRLEFTLEYPRSEDPYAPIQWTGPDTYTCAECGREHDRIHVAWRKPAGMFGPWVVFRYNGREHVPDLSIPIGVEKLPRDAVALSDEECSRRWHS